MSFAQTTIERETKTVKLIDEWKSEKHFDKANQIILNYELQVEGEDDECGNWILSVGIIKVNNEELNNIGKVSNIEINRSYCSNVYIYNSEPGKANIVIDADIITTKNYNSGRNIEIKRLSNGTYQLTNFSIKTLTGFKQFTFNYIALTEAEEKIIQAKNIERAQFHKEEKLKEESIKENEKRQIELKIKEEAKTKVLEESFPELEHYRLIEESIFSTILQKEKENPKIKYPSNNKYYIQGELKITVDTLGKTISIVKNPIAYYDNRENGLTICEFNEFKAFKLPTATWKGYKVKCEYKTLLRKKFEVVYTKVKFKNGNIIEVGYNQSPLFLKQQVVFHEKLKMELKNEGVYLVSYCTIDDERSSIPQKIVFIETKKVK